MPDDLATLLAAEEHRQGAPYLADPDHCQDCAEVDLAWAQAVCGHGDWVSIRALGDPYDTQLCNLCGAMVKVVVETVPAPPPIRDDPSLGEYFGPEPTRPDPGQPEYTGDLWLGISRWWAWYAGPTLLALGIVAAMVLMWFWLVVWR